MIEQPFPIYKGDKDGNIILVNDQTETVIGCYKDINNMKNEFNNQEIKTFHQWIKVKEEYNKIGIKIFADESISSIYDLLALSSLINGVNVKLEKCGGYRKTLMILSIAQKQNLSLWTGTMLGSQLNSTLAANLLYYTQYGDLDGGLLVTADSQIINEGMKWIGDGHIEIHDFTLKNHV